MSLALGVIFGLARTLLAIRVRTTKAAHRQVLFVPSMGTSIAYAVFPPHLRLCALWTEAG